MRSSFLIVARASRRRAARAAGASVVPLRAQVRASATGSVRRPRPRGFTLIELLVVVMIIGIIAALAAPSMRIATYDRHAYEDAGAIMQLFREARLRAVARGAATLVTMTTSGTTNRGTFSLYEAVAQNANGGSTAGYQTPLPSCKTPTIWNTSAVAGASNLTTLIDRVDLNGTPEGEADIETAFSVFGPAGTTNGPSSTGSSYSAIAICFTPLGRSYLLVSGFSTSAPFAGATSNPFDGATANMDVVDIQVTRGTTSGPVGPTVRHVVVGPNGMPRVYSQGK